MERYICGNNPLQTKETGRKPYDPVDMFKLYAYSYLNGLRSSRKIERECMRNIEVMWLTGNLVPHYKTIANALEMSYMSICVHLFLKKRLYFYFIYDIVINKMF